MADLIYLSIWLRDFSPENMLKYWRQTIETFPLSEASPEMSLAIFPFDWSETPVFERTFSSETPPGEVAQLASEFLHDDYAYEVELRWDLWLPDGHGDSGAVNGGSPLRSVEIELDHASENEEPDPGADEIDLEFPTEMQLRRAPSTVMVACMGPGFAPEESDDRAHIQINFGLDTPFLPLEDAEAEESGMDLDEVDVRSRENLQQLVEFVHRLDEILPISKRVLWCESGENLAEKIMAAWHLRL